MKFRCSQL